MILIDETKLLELIIESRSSPRKRASYSPTSPDYCGLQFLANAIQPESYIPPHKHPSGEIWIPLSGSIDLIIFDEEGRLTEVKRLNDKKTRVLEVPEKTYHTGIATEPDSVFGNLNIGPYSPDNKIQAPFAPIERDPASAQYLERLKREIANFVR
ncbi:MAG: WbuC family cupin fold metalloprotein [Candidatus Nanoarchaeia archaeon]|nr:WbuC family cupin fold metalloprotein [Candidatus Nanoarchaeia archaeon]